MSEALRPRKSYLRETELIRCTFAKNLSNFYSINNNRNRIPKFVKKEVADFLSCGILANGFIRLYCKDCKSTEVLAFSCKRRGFCPSCCGRRMNDTAIHLEENVFPIAPIRQWVLSFPFFLRYLMAYDPKVITAILKIHTNEISRYYKGNSGQERTEVKTGAATVIQRFGGALNLNPHFHSVFVDGYFFKKNNKVYFKRVNASNQMELEKLLKVIVKKILRWLERNSYLELESSNLNLLENTMASIHESSVCYKISVGPRKGEEIQIGGSENLAKVVNSGGGLSIKGFNIHAGVSIKSHQREKMSILFRYISRGPLAKGRVEALSDEKILLKFKKPWSNGATHVVYTNLEFIEKLIALVPPQRAHLVRYHGVFAPSSSWRKEICSKRNVSNKKPEKQNKYRTPWAELLKRTFNVDAELCNKCGGKLKPIALIIKTEKVGAILANLNISSKKVFIPYLSERAPPSEVQALPSEDEYSQIPLDW